jgi:ubiquitin C-terminal hydrolase
MQEREAPSPSNQAFSSLKRPREEDQPSPYKKPEILRPTPSKQSDFQTIITQNGDGKAFWYFKSLTYEINNNRKFIRSPEFETSNGDVWNLVLYPSKVQGFLGLFVELKPKKEKIWYRRKANVFIEVYLTGNKLERKSQNSFSDEFSFAKRDWGYDKLLKLSDFMGFMNKPVVFEVTVSPYRLYEQSKLVTGYNGLNNEGTTCYINSLLQTLFFIPDFRKAVYEMPTSEKDEDRIPLSLQLVFCHLQLEKSPASTRDLLRSFGWTSDQQYEQHDVQEFNCVLSDTLEKKMKGTPSEGTYSRLLKGKMKSVIQCSEVNFKSERAEFFNDLQLNVQGCSSIFESFEKYTEAEVLDGDNKYEAEGFGKQVAKKTVIFEYLPPVLQLLLKRFEYDHEQGRMVKLNQFYNVEQNIDLKKFVLSPGEWSYSLISILVHRGTAQAGHYFSYIRPRVDQDWFVFNDDSVDHVATSFALMNSCGGAINELQINENGFVKEVQTSSETCAYMVVYVRDDMIKDIMADVAKEDIPKNLIEIYQGQINKKSSEEKSRELKDSMIDIYLLSNEIIKNWDYPGISNPDSDIYTLDRFSINSRIRATLQMKKTSKGSDLAEEISKKIRSVFKLWVFRPGFINWEFSSFSYNEELQKQLEGKAIFIETTEKVFEYIEETKTWDFSNIETISPCSQDTEIMGEEPELNSKVLIVFKWFEWNDGCPSLSTIKAESITVSNLEDLRNKVYFEKYGRFNDYNQAIHITIEKSSSSSKEGPETYRFLPFETCLEGIHLKNGDCVIGEVVSESSTKNQPSQYLDEKFQNIIFQFHYHNRLESRGYSSYSLQLLQNSNFREFRVETTLKSSENELVHRLISSLNLSEHIEASQIELFTEEGHCFNHLPRDKMRKVQDLVNMNMQVAFDIHPRCPGDQEDYSTVYFVLVNENFEKIKEYHQVLKKPAKVKDLDPSISLEMMKDLQNDSLEQLGDFKCYLVNYPQNCIIRELELSDNIDKYASQPHSLIYCKNYSKQEVFDGFTENQLIIYVFRKGEDRGYSFIQFFSKSITCTELIRVITSKFDEKVRVLHGEIKYVGERAEYKPTKPLEDTDFMFFVRYNETHIAVERPALTNGRNQLKINMN